MKRLLCIVGSMNAGGAETFLMKLYRNFDRSKYQMDFCVSHSEKGFYDDEILSMGGKIIHTIPKSKNPFLSFKNIYDVVRENNYKYVMRVSQHSLSALELLAAKFAGAEILVYRSSNSNTMSGGLNYLLHKIFKFLPKIIANVKMAPSIPASEFMFGKKLTVNKKVILLKNGIPLNNFKFNENARKKIRNELKINEELLIGHVGRFSYQKNHKKLIEIFYEVKKVRADAHLVLIGTGELKDSIITLVHSLGLDDSVYFLGVRNDIPDLFSAMDVFVFPSLFEGMPNVVIEAQSNGLPCIISDTITSEVKMCSNVKQVSLKDTATWSTSIFSATRNSSDVNNLILQKNGYDIKRVVEIFRDSVFYNK